MSGKKRGESTIRIDYPLRRPFQSPNAPIERVGTPAAAIDFLNKLENNKRTRRTSWLPSNK